MIRLVTTRRLRNLRHLDGDVQSLAARLDAKHAAWEILAASCGRMMVQRDQARAIAVDLEQQLARAEQGGAELARTVDVMAVCMRAAVRDGDLGRPADGIEYLRDMVYDTDFEAPAPLGSYASGAALIDAETAARDGEVTAP